MFLKHLLKGIGVLLLLTAKSSNGDLLLTADAKRSNGDLKDWQWNKKRRYSDDFERRWKRIKKRQKKAKLDIGTRLYKLKAKMEPKRWKVNYRGRKGQFVHFDMKNKI